MDDDLIWLDRPPITSNFRIHPGLRHYSRIHTKPRALHRKKDRYPDCQLRLAKNNPNAHPQMLLLLNESKNLFSRQLPNMGSPYIVRLVFDFNAETVIVLHKGVVTGAISSRLFPIEEFVEVVFLAVDSKSQAKGYGRLVMNYLKFSVQAYRFLDILACADNEAVTFFKKLGFNDKTINMDPNRWVKRIKDYEGVTLVHCKIDEEVDYLNMHKTVKEQLSFVQDILGNHFVVPPDTLASPFRKFPESPTFVCYSLKDINKMIKSNVSETEEDLTKMVQYTEKMKKLRATCLEILDKLENDPKFQSVFTRPVTEAIAPKYFDTIKRPMDFATIRKRLNRFPDYYKRPEMFYADIQLIVENCKAFNPSGTMYFSLASSLASQFRTYYNDAFPQNTM